MTRQKQVAAVAMIIGAIYDTIKEAGPMGAPSGVIYAALMGKIPLEMYQEIIRVMVANGKIRQVGHVLYAT